MARIGTTGIPSVMHLPMQLLYLIPLAWGALAAMVVVACQMASRADADLEPSGSGASEFAR